MVQLFSIVAMFIMFRETLEACVVVAVMLNLCTKLKMQSSRKQVWIGVATGVGLSILVGVIFIIIFYVTKNSVFQGKGKAIFKGYVNLIASFLITLLGFAMLRFMNYEAKWERKLKEAHAQSMAKRKATGRGTNWAIFLLCFSAVFREGIEAVVFLAGVSTTESVTAIPIAAVVGIICGLAVGFVLFFTGRQIKDLWLFFIISFIVLYLIAAGLVSTGVSSWQTIGWWGTFYPTSMRPWWNQPVWDTCGCCSDNVTQNKFFGLVNAIFGYQCQPTFISIFSYCAYWLIIAVLIVIKWKRGSLLDADFKRKRRERKERKRLGLPPLTPEEEAKLAAAQQEEVEADLKAPKEVQPRSSSSSSGTASSLERAKQAADRPSPFTVAPAREAELTALKGGKDATL